MSVPMRVFAALLLVLLPALAVPVTVGESLDRVHGEHAVTTVQDGATKTTTSVLPRAPIILVALAVAALVALLRPSARPFPRESAHPRRDLLPRHTAGRRAPPLAVPR